MPDFLHRTLDSFVMSGNAPDYPDVDWIESPVINSQAFRSAGVPVKYAKRNASPDNTVTEMTQGEKDAVDAAELSATRDETSNALDGIDRYERAFALTVLDELNNHADKMNAILDAADNATSLADFKTRMGAITDYPQRTVEQLKTSVRNKLGT